MKLSLSDELSSIIAEREQYCAKLARATRDIPRERLIAILTSTLSHEELARLAGSQNK